MKLGSKSRAGVKTPLSTAARALRVLFIVALASVALPIWQGQVPVAFAETVTIDNSTCSQSGLTTALGQAGAGGTVNFSVDCAITLTAPISISQTVTIDGSGHSVSLDGRSTVQIFIVATTANATSPITFTLNNVTLSHAHAANDRGGAIYVPGNDPGNPPNSPSFGAQPANIVVNNVNFDSNTALHYGAAIESDFGNVTVNNSTFSNNIVGFNGGAINNNEVPGPNQESNFYKMTLSGDEFDGNSASNGGAIGLGTNSPATIINSTFANNSATTVGSAIYTWSSVSLLFSTVDSNTGANAGLGFGASSGHFTLKADILANNSSGVNCAGGTGTGTFTDAGDNIAYPNSQNCNFSTTTSTVEDPLLGSLQDNGGPTKTMALGSSSRAIGAALDCTDLSGTQVGVDQRGVARPTSACDTGAYQTSPLGGNLIINGSFEAPSVNPGTGGFYQNNQVPGWSLCAGPDMEIQNNVAGAGPAEDGSQYSELDSDGPSTICQTVSTVPGQTYQLSFYFAGRMGFGTSANAMDAKWGSTDLTPNDLSVDATNDQSVVWTQHTFTVTATSGAMTIRFAYAGTPPSCTCGALLDNVQLTTATPATPTPVFTAGENGSYTWGGTAANPVAITGTAPVGSAISLFSGITCTGTALGTATADGSGNWSVPVSGLSAGPTSFSANASAPATGISACASPITVNVDRLAPTSHLTFPAVGSGAQYENAGAWTAGCGTASTDDICGTASDTGGSGVQAVYVAIQNSSNQFWNGTTFGSSATWLRANGTTSWNLPVPLPADDVYTIASAAIDNAGIAESTFSSSVAGLCSPSGAGGQLSVNGGQLSINGGLCPVNLTTPSGPFSGQLSINGGQLSVNGGQLSVNGGQLSVNGGETITGGTCTLTDPSGNTVTGTLTGGTISGGGGQLSINGGQLSVNGGQLSINGGQLSVNGGQLSINGGGLTLDGGTCTGVTTSGGTGGQLSINGGTVTSSGSGQLSINGGQLSVNGGQLSVNGGLFSLNGGQLSVNGGLGGDAGNVVVDTVAPYVSNFTIDNQTASGASNINPDATFHIAFDESMLGSTLNTSNITVTSSNGSSFTPTLTADPTGLNVSFGGFQGSTTYTVTVSGATDLAGNPIGTNGGSNPNSFTFTTATTVPFAVADTRGNDDDGDTIPNGWDGTTTPTFTLGAQSTNTAAWGFKPEHKDLCLVENYMVGTANNSTGAGTTMDQHITKAANQAIVNAFANAPVSNPDGTTGIHLVIFEGPTYSAGLPTGYNGPYFGGQINMVDPLGKTANGAFNWGASASSSTSAPSGSGSFESIRAQNFVHTGLSQFCHYAVIAHTLGGTGSSGASRGIGSSDFVVALGGTVTGAGVGTQAEQQGTVMHELGHNLGLHHGGGPGISDMDVNYKPDYMSVMNYFYQFEGVPGGFTTNGLDYSHGTITAGLNENSLADAAGLGSGSLLSSGAVFGTRYFCPGSSTASIVANASLPINWSCGSSGPQPSGSTDVSDINADGAFGTLHDYNDWAHISFSGGDIGEGAVPPAPLTTTVDISGDNGGVDSAPKIESVLGNFGWTGFFAPINSDNTGTVVNTGKAGRTYPIKFQLKDATGNYVSTLSAVRSITISNSAACSNGTTDSIAYSTSSTSGLHYDSTANQFVYNWATPSAPGCYMLNVNLADGTTDLALFSLQ